MDGGIDWTGTPDAPPEDGTGVSTIFGAAVVVFNPACEIDSFCATVRDLHGLKQDYEFHAYKLTGRPEILASLLGFVQENATIYALLWDKRALFAKDKAIFDKPHLLTAAAELAVLKNVVGSFPLNRLWCDEEISGEDNQKAFSAKLKAMQKERWGDAQRGPTIKYRKSTKSNLIQLADAPVYILQRYIRGLKISPEIQKQARQIWETTEVQWGKEGDLRPYLPWGEGH